MILTSTTRVDELMIRYPAAYHTTMLMVVKLHPTRQNNTSNVKKHKIPKQYLKRKNKNTQNTQQRKQRKIRALTASHSQEDLLSTVMLG